MKSYFSTCTDSGSNTCNGDGDAKIDNGGDNLPPYEDIRFWQHLSLAGLLQGNFSGLYVASQRHEPGVTVPVTPYGGNQIAYRVFYAPNWAYGYNDNLFMISKQGANVSGTATDSVMNSVDAHSIDLKVDDGLPGSGNVLFGRGGESSLSGCVSIYWNGGSNPALLAPMDTNITCRMAFKF